MKLLKYLAITLFFLIVVVGVIGLFLPDTRHVEREISIDAPAEAIFPYMNDLREFQQWFPWAGIDPATQYTYSGPATGVGSKLDWLSTNGTIGSGSLEIKESDENSRVIALLELGKNDPALSTLTLEGDGQQTRVRWAFDINLSNTISRYFGLTTENWVGYGYEKGLKDLKSLVETQ